MIVPVLQDAGEVAIAVRPARDRRASIADFASVLLLTLLFSGESTGTGAKLILIGAFAARHRCGRVGVAEAEHSRGSRRRWSGSRTPAPQIRVRGAFVLLIGMVALAEQLGLELILGAFAAGAILNHLDMDDAMTHPEFRAKLAAVGFGVFIPVFFVSSGVRFDLDALFAAPRRDRLDPGVPRRRCSSPAACRRCSTAASSARAGSIAAALLQATSLPFIVAATADRPGPRR